MGPIDSRFRLLARLTQEDGAALGACPVEPDWYPAEEALRFDALRRHGRAPLLEARVEPLWDKAGAPWVRAIEVSMEDIDAPLRFELPITYFRRQVHAAATALLGEEVFKDSSLNYQLTAFPISEENPPATGSGLWKVREIHESPIGGHRRLNGFMAAASSPGEPQSEAAPSEDFPVFIPESLLIQAEELKDAAAENETGGILIGHLWQDTDSSEVFAEVTALVPAHNAIATSTRLTFTPDTWDAVHAAITLRGRGEVWLGWLHTHPSRHWCKCTEEKQKTCPLGKQFFSSDDIALHRAVFPRAFHLAVVTGDQPADEGGWEMVHSAWGWRNGVVASRSFFVLRRTPDQAPDLDQREENATNP